MSIKRIDHVLVDELGVDPLRDTYFDAVMAVERWTPFVVTDQYQNNPQRIAYDNYGTVDLWPAVLYYNKIADPWQLTSGLEIKIPDLNELTTSLSTASVPPVRTQRI